jgi:hypothetical protein
MPSIINSTTTNGIVVSGDNSGSLQLASNNGTTAVTINTSQNVGIGTSSPSARLHILASSDETIRLATSTVNPYLSFYESTSRKAYIQYAAGGGGLIIDSEAASAGICFNTQNTERMRITSGGQLQFGATNDGPAQNDVAGFSVTAGGVTEVSASSTNPFFVNRKGNDGGLVSLRQAGTQEGDISVSGTTVSYNGGHLSRWSQLPDGSKDDTILKGTVLTNLDDMCVWTKDGTVLDNEQLNKMQVSSVEGDTNVAGVFVNWTRDEDCNTDDMNVAMTGDMIIRIAEGVTVQRGDLLMSAGDGTAKPQGDDIVRSKTIAKVTSNHVTCTYEDGSYCVPCVLMAC